MNFLSKQMFVFFTHFTEKLKMSLPIRPVISRTLLLAEVGGVSIPPPAGVCSLGETVVYHFRLHVYQHCPGHKIW